VVYEKRIDLMKLSLRGEYALRALVVLGMQEGKSVMKISEIAGRQNIPQRFLEQILNEMRGLGWLESKRGIAGGYRLRVSADLITVADIIRAIEGPLSPVSCVSRRSYAKCSCPDESACGIRSVMQQVHTAISSVLERVTLAELCERTRLLQSQVSHLGDYAI
jgi:Rrf2 family protein